MISGIVLAAGSSSRLGRPKQLLELAGKLVLQHVVDAAAAAPLDEILVVLGHSAGEVADRLALPAHGRVVLNPDHALGQSTSLQAGLRAAAPGADAAVVLLGDQPGIRPEAIRHGGGLRAAQRRAELRSTRLNNPYCTSGDKLSVFVRLGGGDPNQ